MEKIEASLNLKEIFEKSKETKEKHSIEIKCLISPDTDSRSPSILHGNVKPFGNNDEFGDFGEYCLFTIYLTKRNGNFVELNTEVVDSAGKQIKKKPVYFSDMSKDNCLMFEYKSNDCCYECGRTYFHFSDDKNNVTFEGDFMHYKCKLINVKIENTNTM